jgi:hypothetical protein
VTTAFTTTLSELNDPATGRMDAQRIADYLGVPLTQLAGALGKRYQSLHKTPAAPSVQDGLRPIKASLDILAYVLRDRSMIRTWLNSPHPDLGMRIPLRVMLEGHADAVETMLANALEGIPS